MKKLKFGISGGISFLLFVILAVAAGRMGRSLSSQNAAYRWDKEGGTSHVSCFFSVNAGMTADKIKEFEYGIDAALKDASVEQESENPSARLWVDAYSADGKILLSTDKASIEADAIGIGGDFFLFHPLKLLSGAYFSGNDLMQDYCIIDQDAAWQLFGSNNVAGMTLYVSGTPHIIAGVVERQSGKMYKNAGLDGTLVYVSYKTLSETGWNNGINHYEILMPNPVSQFAYNYVKEKLATVEKEVEVVENSARYSLVSRLKLIPKFGSRSMNGKAIIYPYWENVARGYEDILLLITFFEMFFLLYGILVVLVLLIWWWKHKGWTIREKRLKLKDKAERLIEKSREKRWKASAERKKTAKETAKETAKKTIKKSIKKTNAR